MVSTVPSVFINKPIWDTFSEQEMADYKEAIFQHYRQSGFPYYNLTIEERRQEFESLNQYDYPLLVTDNVVKQTMHGLALAWSYHHHSWSIPCGKMLTPMQVFRDDALFRKAIDKRIKYGGYMSDSGIRKTLRTFSGTQGVSNFRPTAAAAIYHALLPPEGGTVWDMSSGFGGRLLGAMVCDKVHRYIGTDPSTETMKGLLNMQQELAYKVMDVELHQLGSEEFIPEPGTLDLCFTSPPYFDTEKYSTEPTQSYIKYPTKDTWLNGFMAKTLENCSIGLKSTGLLAINIANVKTYPTLEADFVSMATSHGWRLERTMFLALSRIMGTKVQGEKFKHEPIFIFSKI